MQECINEEYELFLADMERGETFCRYMDEDNYEDEYSHNDIDAMQEELIRKIAEWLHKNKPGQYLVSPGWCVFVMTVAEAEKRNLLKYKNRIIY